MSLLQEKLGKVAILIRKGNHLRDIKKKITELAGRLESQTSEMHVKQRRPPQKTERPHHRNNSVHRLPPLPRSSGLQHCHSAHSKLSPGLRPLASNSGSWQAHKQDPTRITRLTLAASNSGEQRSGLFSSFHKGKTYSASHETHVSCSADSPRHGKGAQMLGSQ